MSQRIFEVATVAEGAQGLVLVEDIQGVGGVVAGIAVYAPG
jgi:hypothetical protein